MILINDTNTAYHVSDNTNYDKELNLKNEFAAYPPINLSKNQMSAFVYLLSAFIPKQSQDLEAQLNKLQEKANLIKDPNKRALSMELDLKKIRTSEIKKSHFLSHFNLDGFRKNKISDNPDEDTILLSEQTINRENRKLLKLAKELSDIKLVHTEDILKLLELKDKEDENKEKPVEVLDEDKSIIISNIFEEVSFKKDTISITLSVTGHALFFNFKDNFTKLKYTQFMPSGKYSWGIYMYMRSKLFKGKNEITLTEPVEDFKKRFGIDKIKTYNRWFEFDRRVLKMVEKDINESKDIYIRFKGISPNNSQKINHIQYTIWEYNHATYTKKSLSESQQAAVDFLINNKVNKKVAYNILNHPDCKREVFRGFELLFLQDLWTYVKQESKAKEIAGVFVDWWKKGTLGSSGGQYKNNKIYLELEEKYRKLKFKQYNEDDANIDSKGVSSIADYSRKFLGKK